AVDVNELFDQLLATFLIVTASATIVTTSTAAAAIATATPAAAATAAARSAALRLLSLLRLLGLGRSSLGDLRDLGRVGIGLVGLVLVLHSRTPVRLRGQRQRGPLPGRGRGSRHGRTRPWTRPPSWRAQQ